MFIKMSGNLSSTYIGRKGDRRHVSKANGKPPRRRGANGKPRFKGNLCPNDDLNVPENYCSGYFSLALRHGEDGDDGKHIAGVPLDDVKDNAYSGFVPWKHFLQPRFEYLQRHELADCKKPISIPNLCEFSIAGKKRKNGGEGDGEGERRFEYYVETVAPGTDEVQYYVRAKRGELANMNFDKPGPDEMAWWEAQISKLNLDEVLKAQAEQEDNEADAFDVDDFQHNDPDSRTEEELDQDMMDSSDERTGLAANRHRTPARRPSRNARMPSSSSRHHAGGHGSHDRNERRPRYRNRWNDAPVQRSSVGTGANSLPLGTRSPH
ncbi:unnamed protein product [Amoebophrya sp. A120]|nr:unnamed protein product [Amoebophrya sp. A120]|eukprot:GSA120T00005966001.1